MSTAAASGLALDGTGSVLVSAVIFDPAMDANFSIT